jgi:DNA polymerase-3 subunit gamma/tau
MTRLYEKYRPASFDDMAGNTKAVAQLKRMADQGIGGKAVWIAGPSGMGKTTAARILAGTIADPKWGTIEVDAGAVSPELVRDWSRDCWKYGWGKGGRAWIINESHGLRAATIRALLVWLEELPSHCCVIFTTTHDGADKLFEDQIDASPLLSRCLEVCLTNQSTAQAFAERCQFIAKAEGLDGQPIEAYLKLIRKCKGNLRMAIQAIEAGEMLVSQ